MTFKDFYEVYDGDGYVVTILDKDRKIIKRGRSDKTKSEFFQDIISPEEIADFTIDAISLDFKIEKLYGHPIESQWVALSLIM